jgi:membrane-bound ClpP family serine protease
VIILGVILILVGYLLPVPGIIATIGWILLVIGLVLCTRPDGSPSRWPPLLVLILQRHTLQACCGELFSARRTSTSSTPPELAREKCDDLFDSRCASRCATYPGG